MRRFVSLLLLIVCLILTITGIQMLLPHPHGSEGGGIPFYPKGLHEYASYLFIVAGGLHTFFNRRSLAIYIKQLF